MPRKSKPKHTPHEDQQWQQAWEQPDALHPDRKELLLHNIHQRFDSGRRKKKQLFYIGLSAAAAILVAVLIKIPWTQQEVPVEAWTELVSTDSTRKVRLEDGSVLWMAPRSVVRVYPDFKHKRNTLLTKGTVFFSIARDTTRPFSIGVNNQEVTVLGTQFTINKLDSTDIQLTVKEGKVALSNMDGRNVLAARQQVTTRHGKAGAVQTADPLTADWWAQPEIRLYNISIETLLRCIESYYGVVLSKGHINPAMKISLTWNMTIPLADNLKVLNALTGYNIH
ncbi:FecR family protein [Paraflavitalea speifideaquila]|uniref:FecR family protein n=1 Tax=Paraflavitalea speifideaquila TaxID=3076558 RepID=UPI0028E832B0|nr:FecR domain-containing protein [Paraflavitalea speifideiaquila]